MAFTPEQQSLYDFARDSVPKLFFSKQRPEEEIRLMVEIFDRVRAEQDLIFSQSLILNATDGPPDYLNQHAIDRNTRRQVGESNVALRSRLRTVEDAVTHPSLVDAIQAVLDAESTVGPFALVEFTYDQSYFAEWVSDTGIGGEFVGTAPDMEFGPDAGFASANSALSVVSNFRPQIVGDNLIVSGATNPLNDGTFEVTGLNGARVTYQNAAGVAGADASAAWTHEKVDDLDGNVMDGFSMAFFDRGNRFATTRPTILVILPFGCTAGTRESVLEALRQKKGAGVVAIVECRTIP